MYKISVPVMNSNLKRNNREKTLQEIKKLGAERVFLALDSYELDREKRNFALQELADNCAFFKAHGFEVGAWIWTFLVNGNRQFRNMRSVNGTEIKKYMCPTDESFVEFASGYIADVAKCGVSLILFDDDFRYGFLAESPACLCDRHIAVINDLTGEALGREELQKYITTGKKNKFRDAYLKANGDALRNFAAAMRAAVDQVDPRIRVGACACITSWDIDGTDAYEIAKILAGNTKPLTRLIGAPYWAVEQSWGNGLQDVVELERMESAWTKRPDLEIMAEGDVFPRPRINCPASFLEGFDTAIRASGCTDGILKYALDYTSKADYETGYTRFHQRNIPLYGAIDKAFGEKRSCGVRVYESMKKVADMEIPTETIKETDIQSGLFSNGAKVLSHNGIPSVYEGAGVCGIVFGENARALPMGALDKGLILDISAARILRDRGVDVGIEKIADPLQKPREEHFVHSGNDIMISGATVYDITVKENAEILSYVEMPEGAVPVSYRYENADGKKFLVFNIRVSQKYSAMLKHYERGCQIARNIPWLSGEKLPAYIYGHPSLYMQCKKNEKAMAVGLWNFFADTAIEPVVELEGAFRDIRFINCSGKMEEDKVYLSDISPFDFVGFEVFR